MLGKGLESLIPKGGAQPGNSSDAPLSRDGSVPASAPSSAPAEAQAQRATNPVSEEPVSEPAFKRAFSGEEEQKIRPRRTGEESIFHIEIEKIKPNPFQPRRDFNQESLRELADSIREYGVLQPVIVSKIEKEVPMGTEVEYELIAGERRWLASKLLGLERIPAIVRKIDFEKDRLEMAIIENLQRENLNPLETARAFARLQDEFRLTQREIGTRLGKSRETVANTMRLLDLPTHIQDALAEGKISESHGRLLLSVTDKAAQEGLFHDLTDRHLTTRELKGRVLRAKSGATDAPVSGLGQGFSPELKMFQEKLSMELGAPVEIKQHGETGKITITFYSGEELKNIMERLGGAEEN